MSATTTQRNTANKIPRSGAWTQPELDYVWGLTEGFHGGWLDIEDGLTLRLFLADSIGCTPKRVSKRMENMAYNGRATFTKQHNLSDDELKVKRERLQGLKDKFEESLEELKDRKGNYMLVPKHKMVPKKKTSTPRKNGMHGLKPTDAPTPAPPAVAAPDRLDSTQQKKGSPVLPPLGSAEATALMAASRAGILGASTVPAAAFSASSVDVAGILLHGASRPAALVSSGVLDQAIASLLGSVLDAPTGRFDALLASIVGRAPLLTAPSPCVTVGDLLSQAIGPQQMPSRAPDPIAQVLAGTHAVGGSTVGVNTIRSMLGPVHQQSTISGGLTHQLKRALEVESFSNKRYRLS